MDPLPDPLALVGEAPLAEPPFTDFSLFSSVRYDVGLMQLPADSPGQASWNGRIGRRPSPFYLLDFHRDRILNAAYHWYRFNATIVLSGNDALLRLEESALEFIGPAETKPLRLRIMVDREGSISFEKFDTPALPLENLFPQRLTPPGAVPGPGEPPLQQNIALLLDKLPLSPSEFTHFKTTQRSMYEDARQRVGIRRGDDSEVLFINQLDHSIMECSTTTPYFWRGGKWITPPISSAKIGSGGQDGVSRRWALERYFPFYLFCFVVIAHTRIFH